MNDNTLIFKNSIYVRIDSFSDSDGENLGKAIGVGIYGKRTLTDYIWPIWGSEYKNDKGNNHVLVKGLMDVGSVYEKKVK